jgi:hypothetical protein
VNVNCGGPADGEERIGSRGKSVDVGYMGCGWRGLAWLLQKKLKSHLVWRGQVIALTVVQRVEGKVLFRLLYVSTMLQSPVK